MSPVIPSRLRYALVAVVALLSFGAFAGAGQAKKPVSVFPAPNSEYASDDTTFSFRGLKPKQLGKVRVVGSRTGVKRTVATAPLRRTRRQRRSQGSVQAR